MSDRLQVVVIHDIIDPIHDIIGMSLHGMSKIYAGEFISYR